MVVVHLQKLLKHLCSNCPKFRSGSTQKFKIWPDDIQLVIMKNQEVSGSELALERCHLMKSSGRSK